MDHFSRASYYSELSEKYSWKVGNISQAYLHAPKSCHDRISEETPMKKKRVLVMRNSYLLSAGVECLLHEQQELEVISLDIEFTKQLVEEIINVKPDVMEIDESTS